MTGVELKAALLEECPVSYSAVGGEAVALLLPVLWYLISQTVRDFTKDAKNGYLPDYKEENEP